MAEVRADDQRLPKPSVTGQIGSPASSWRTAAEPGGDELRRIKSELTQAREEYRLGEYVAVVNRLERYVQGAKSSSWFPSASAAAAFVVLGRSLAELGRAAEAQLVLEDAVAQFEATTDIQGQDWSDYGVALYMTGRTKQAIEALERALPYEGILLADTYLNLGRVLIADGQYERAESRLRSAVELTPDDPRPRLILADTLRVLERPQEAAAELRNGAMILASSGRLAEALSLISDAVSLQPDDAGLLQLRGEILRAMGEYQEALQEIERALAQRVESVPLLIDKGSLLAALSRYPEAAVALDRALELDPGSAMALGIKGQVLRALGRDQDALEALQRAAELDPDSAWIQAELGETLRALDRNQDALEALDRALSLDPDSAWTLGTKGQVLRALDRNQDALAALRRAAELGPALSWVQSELAAACFTTGHSEEARAAVDRALALDPDNNLALAIQGQLLSDSGNYEQAVVVLDQALAIAPDYLYAILIKATALRGLERYQDALALLDKALEIEPTSQYALGTKALYFCDVAMFDEALRTLALIGEAALQPWSQAGRGLALLHFGADRAAEAKQDFEAALAAEASTLWWRVGLGDALRLLRDPAAKVQYEHCIRYADEQGLADADSLSLIGWCQYRLSHYDDAARLFAQAISLDPADASKQFNLALVLLCGDQGSLAAEEYDRGFHIAATKADLLYRRGLLALAGFDLDEAIAEGDRLRLAREGDEAEQATATTARKDTELWRSLRSRIEENVAAIELDLKSLAP